MIKINDVTISVQFNLSQGEKRLLELVNACVSHEMRNPINSIFGMNIQLKELGLKMFDLLRLRGIEGHDIDQLRDLFAEAIDVQESSTKLLNFYVTDLLSLAQIERGNFRKSKVRFDLREAVDEIMKIQKQKADSKNIVLTQQLVGFEDENY